MKNQYLKELMEQMDEVVSDTASFTVHADEASPAVITVREFGRMKIYVQDSSMTNLELISDRSM